MKKKQRNNVKQKNCPFVYKRGEEANDNDSDSEIKEDYCRLNEEKCRRPSEHYDDCSSFLEELAAAQSVYNHNQD